MPSLNAIWAIYLRHYRLLVRDANLLLATFYWPLLDILIWGFLGSWIQRIQSGGLEQYEVIALLGIVLWQTTCRSAIVTAGAFVEELWSRNILNLLSLPISLFEWIAGITLYNFILSCATSAYCMLLIFLIYHFPMWSFISSFCLFAFPLFLSGLWLGFMCLYLVTILGKRSHELAYVLAWFFAPFSTAFYPKEILPEWAQTVSAFLPMSYIFEGMRAYLIQGANPTIPILKALIMSSAYLTIAIFIFRYGFNKSKNKGLARLAD